MGLTVWRAIMNRVPTEAQEQKALVDWLRAKNAFFFAPTNENNTYKQNSKYAMINEVKARSLGKLKGVSDIVVFLPKVILFIELKRRPKRLKSGKISYSNSKISKEQDNFIEKVNSYPYAKGAICYGAEEAIKFIKENI